jgi:hypothetical protein
MTMTAQGPSPRPVPSPKSDPRVKARHVGSVVSLGTRLAFASSGLSPDLIAFSSALAIDLQSSGESPLHYWASGVLLRWPSVGPCTLVQRE